jgi:hypothetical protein
MCDTRPTTTGGGRAPGIKSEFTGAITVTNCGDVDVGGGRHDDTGLWVQVWGVEGTTYCEQLQHIKPRWWVIDCFCRTRPHAWHHDTGLMRDIDHHMRR